MASPYSLTIRPQVSKKSGQIMQMLHHHFSAVQRALPNSAHSNKCHVNISEHDHLRFRVQKKLIRLCLRSFGSQEDYRSSAAAPAMEKVRVLAVLVLTAAILFIPSRSQPSSPIVIGKASLFRSSYYLQ